MISEHPISTGLRGLTGCQREPQDKGVTYFKEEITIKFIIKYKTILLNL